jgi:hypothetical protein
MAYEEYIIMDDAELEAERFRVRTKLRSIKSKMSSFKGSCLCDPPTIDVTKIDEVIRLIDELLGDL